MKHYGALLRVVAITAAIVWSQNVYTQSFSVTNISSDYYEQINWDFTNDPDYGVEDNYPINIGIMSSCGVYPYIGYHDFSGDGIDLPTGSANLAFRPGLTQNGARVEIEYSEFYVPNCNGSLNISTESLRTPSNVKATDGLAYDKIRITWQKATDVPDNMHSYRIYKDNVLLTTVAGTVREYTDTGLQPGQSFTYKVTTYSTNWGTVESAMTQSDVGTTVFFSASDGAYQSRTKLEWNNISQFAEDIRILRSIPGSSLKEELIILNRNATTYNDVSGIPGYNYTYYMEPIDPDTLYTPLSNSGYNLPNGVIRGYVKSPLGAGVSGVTINIEYTGTAPTGGGVAPNCTTKYCTTTDVSGFYEVKGIYYFTGAQFRIVPYKMTNVVHDFTPDTLIRTLDESVSIASAVDFVDETVITVSGEVYYASDSCGIGGVTILLDDEDLGIRTASDGSWNTAISDPGTYSFRAEHFDHTYVTTSGAAEYNVLVNQDNLNLDFKNTTLRTVEVLAQGGCQIPLGDSVQISVTATGGCFQSRTYWVQGANMLTINDLPPRDGYTFDVVSIRPPSSNQTNILSQLEEIDLDLLEPDSYLLVQEGDSLQITPASTTTLPDGTMFTIPADTAVISFYDSTFSPIPRLRFIYRAPIVISIDFEAAGATVADCSGSPYDGIPVMERGVSYPLEIDVYEQLNSGQCPIDQGELIIYDEVGDIPFESQVIPIQGGKAFYTVVAGEPDIAVSTNNNHQKWLYIVPQIDFAPASPVTKWIFVEGIKSNTPTFTSGTPELPQLIIHDPPGDNSFAFVEEGTSVTTFTKSGILNGGSGGLFVDTHFGIGGSGFGITAKAGLGIEFSMRAGRNDQDEDGFFTTISFTQAFATSSSDLYTSGDGDVYIGSAINQTFAISQELTLDDSCAAEIDSILEIGLEGFETTFIYSEKHIVSTLLPQLAVLMSVVDTSTNEGKMLFNQYRADSISWASIVATNQENREDASEAFLEEENISISAGATLSRSYASTTGVNTESAYDIFFDESLKVGVEAELSGPGGYFEIAGGVMQTFQHITKEVEGEVNDTLRTIGYVIEDNDLGDFITFDIYQDPDYDVPIFRTISGTTSCPNEPGTQPRDVPGLSIFPSVISNVPAGGQGVFRCDVANLSESGESREYAVRVVSATNPDGALVRLGGSIINFSPASVFIAPGQTVQFTLTVEAGPLASDYEDIQIMVYPPCEYELWQNNGTLINGDTFSISVHFESVCTNVNLVNPVDNWLLNQQSNNTLHATFGGFDINNPYLEALAIWIKPDGGGYTKLMQIDTPDILSPFHDVFINMSEYPDGGYTIKASAECSIDVGRTYSNELHGIIDRNSLAPFGIPTPSDGFLREGQEASVTFDKNIDCDFGDYPAEFSLVREDTNTPIPFTTSCFGNKVIINTSPHLTDQADLEGVVVRARVHLLQDQSGNPQEYPTEWSFRVNVNPVFWDPENVMVSETVGMLTGFTGILKNVALQGKSFSLDTLDVPSVISYPEWAFPLQTRGTVLSNESYTVHFGVDPDLPPGIYTGTVVAAVDSLPVSMDVTYEVLATPVSWHFDPATYENTMTVVCQFSLNSTNAPLSEDTRDLVGAFVNGEIRGIANIQYIPENNSYAAYLTVHGVGGQNGETIRFRFWKALTGIEYQAMESTAFVKDTRVGSPGAPFILHPEGVFQVIPLRKGWNWISFNLNHTDMSRERLFASLIAPNKTNDIVINSQSQSCTFAPGSGWLGNLQTLALGRGYMVHLSDHPDTLRIVGNPPGAPVTINLTNTWNWIGFPEQTPRDVSEVLDSLSPVAGNELKSQSAFAVWDAASLDWLGTLRDFNPGQGYKLRLSANATLQFRDPTEYTPLYGNFENSMNVLVAIDGLPTSIVPDKGALKVGAFKNGQCLGVAMLEYVPALDDYRGLLMIMGNVADEGENIELRVLDTNVGKEYMPVNYVMIYEKDVIIGSIDNPYVLLFDQEDELAQQYHLWQAYPNPTSGHINFSYELAQDAHVTLSIWTSGGQCIYTIADQEMFTGAHSVSYDASGLDPGVYFYSIETEGFSAMRKFVKK